MDKVSYNSKTREIYFLFSKLVNLSNSPPLLTFLGEQYFDSFYTFTGVIKRNIHAILQVIVTFLVTHIIPSPPSSLQIHHRGP